MKNGESKHLDESLLLRMELIEKQRKVKGEKYRTRTDEQKLATEKYEHLKEKKKTVATYEIQILLLRTKYIYKKANKYLKCQSSRNI